MNFRLKILGLCLLRVCEMYYTMRRLLEILAPSSDWFLTCLPSHPFYLSAWSLPTAVGWSISSSLELRLWISSLWHNEPFARVLLGNGSLKKCRDVPKSCPYRVKGLVLAKRAYAATFVINYCLFIFLSTITRSLRKPSCTYLLTAFI